MLEKVSISTIQTATQLAQRVLTVVRVDIARNIVVKYIHRMQKRVIIMNEEVITNGVYF